MEKTKDFYFVEWLCKSYKKDKTDIHPHDFDTIWDFIQSSSDLSELSQLTDIAPMGMLKFRLMERIKELSHN